MQFKSEKFWSNTSAKFFTTSSVIAVLALGVFSRISSATITLSPVNVDGTILGNVQNDSFYYPYFYTTAQQEFGAFTASPSPTPIPTFGTIGVGVSFVDLGQDPNTNAPSVSTQNGVIYFSIQSTITSSNPIAVAATIVTGSTTSGTYLVPIISVNGAFCNNSSCMIGTGGVFSGFSTAYYYGADYGPGSTIIVGISPQSICKSVSGVIGGAVAAGCEGYPWANLTNPTALTTMPINFNIYNQSDLQTAINTSPFVAPSAAPLDTAYPVNMEFETLSPVVTPSPNPSPTPNELCTFVDGVGNTYTPQQGGLTINGTTQIFNVTGDPDGLGPNQIVVIAAQSPTPLNSLAGNYINNVIATPVPAGQSPSEVIGNFTNSTDPNNPVFYTVGFLAEDAAGFVFDPGSSGGSCVFPGPFDTSAVQGFLNESKCFIATAAFRSMDAAPLVLLRAFRDHFLEHFSLGKNFVHWYYGWSPDAAEWLIDHPIFRFPVLLALIPLQITAWLVLHPILLLLLFLSFLMILGVALFRQSTIKIGRSTE